MAPVMAEGCRFNRRVLKAPYLILGALVVFGLWRRNWLILGAVPAIYLGLP
jgi:hypothetical protein